MACSFEGGARTVKVVVSIWSMRCSLICVGSHWPFLGLRPSPRWLSRDATRSRSYRAAPLMSATKKSSVYGSKRAPLYRKVRR
jgi:hypothetical protein